MVRTDKRLCISNILGSSLWEREPVLEENKSLEGGQPSAMELIDFAIETFGGTGLGIERSGDDAETGLFFCRTGELLGFDFDLGLGGSDFVIEQRRFGGLRANEAPFVGDEAIDEFVFGDGTRCESGEPTLAEEFILLGALVQQQDGGAFFFGAGVATVNEPSFAGALFSGGGDGPFGAGSVLTGLFGPRIPG